MRSPPRQRKRCDPESAKRDRISLGRRPCPRAERERERERASENSPEASSPRRPGMRASISSGTLRARTVAPGGAGGLRAGDAPLRVNEGRADVETGPPGASPCSLMVLATASKLPPSSRVAEVTTTVRSSKILSRTRRPAIGAT